MTGQEKFLSQMQMNLKIKEGMTNAEINKILDNKRKVQKALDDTRNS